MSLSSFLVGVHGYQGYVLQLSVQQNKSLLSFLRDYNEDMMKVGDLVKFTVSEYLGTIVCIDEVRCEIFVHGEAPFKNPTWMSMDILKRNAEVVNESR